MLLYQKINFYLYTLIKATAILFLTIYLLSSTEAQQFLKLPAAFQHFQAHQKENNNLTVVHFLAIHYLHGSPNDKDHEEDMKLPFKTCCDCISSIVPAFIPVGIQLSTAKFIEIPAIKNYLSQDQFIISSYPASIWQPPKYV